MSTVLDSFAPGSAVSASLTPKTVASFDPVVRQLLGGTQVFVKQADGRWRPRGCSLGLARCFEFSDLQGAVERP